MQILGTIERVEALTETGGMRTKAVEGFFRSQPFVGQPFYFFAEPLDPNADIRVIETSPVVEKSDISNGYEFKTANSLYRVVISPDN